MPDRLLSRCENCQAEKLVAFSCKRRSFCPNCGRGYRSGSRSARKVREAGPLRERPPAALVADPDNAIFGDMERAREIIREMVGEIRVTPENGHLFYEMGLSKAPLAALAGGASQMDVVAGGGFLTNELVWKTEIRLR